MQEEKKKLIAYKMKTFTKITMSIDITKFLYGQIFTCKFKVSGQSFNWLYIWLWSCLLIEHYGEKEFTTAAPPA